MTGSTAANGYFDSAYRDYEAQNSARKLDHYLDHIDDRVSEGRKVLLDVGCGLGSFAAAAAERHPDWDIAASDLDLEAVETTARRVPGARVVQSTATENPFPDASFDIVTAWDVIEHVHDRDAAANAILRMLKPGGLWVFVVPVYDGITGPIIRRLDKDPTHVHKLGRDDWIGWAEQRVVSVEWHGLVRYLLGSQYIHMWSNQFRRHTPAILVSGFKPVD